MAINLEFVGGQQIKKIETARCRFSDFEAVLIKVRTDVCMKSSGKACESDSFFTKKPFNLF